VVEEFLNYAVAQTHPLVKSWYTLDELRENWLGDVKRDAEEFFSDEFALAFSSNCKALGLSAEMFKHRLLETGVHRFIAGIRFFGMDLNRPFVEVARINKPVPSDAERDEITKALCQSFSVFRPTRWRIYQSSHLEYQFIDCEGDKRYLLGRLEDINNLNQPRGSERLSLRLTQNLEFYPRYMNLYKTLYQECPWLPDVSRQESLEDMKEYIQKGWLYEVFVDGQWAGVTAASNDTLVGAKGHYMIDIALEKPFRGQGLGVALQRLLAATLADKSGPSSVLSGTIGSVNIPMLKTASRVGRVDVGGNVWVMF
jgi:GNAT superfamily N-acetyltransferase